MAPLMMLNPRRRKTGAKKKRKRKMSAKQLKFFGPRKSAKEKKRAKAKVIIVESNPKGKHVAKKKRRSRRKAKVFTHNPKRRRHFRRNPRSIEAGFVKNTLLPGAIGAAGAIGTDVLVNFLPIPPQFKTGMMNPVIKIGSALLVGMLVGAVSSREAGEEAAAGGVIVALYTIARGFMQHSMPNVNMGRYVPMNRYVPMGYLPPGAMMRPGGGANMNPRQLGYMNPARVSAPVSRANMRFLATR